MGRTRAPYPAEFRARMVELVRAAGEPLEYRNWFRRGWRPVLERAGVQPRARDAQKALRRTYVTSSLMLDRNPKLIAAELGHTTARMVTDNYDSWMDPSRWPDEEELDRLRAVYGWARPGTGGRKLQPQDTREALQK